MFLLMCCSVLLIIVWWLFTRPGDPPKLLDVYSRPGKFYTLKYHLMRWLIARRQKKALKKNEKADPMQGNFQGSRSIDDLEMKQKLPEGKPWAGDCVFFDASNSDQCYFTLGTAQRPNNIINMFHILRIPGMGTFTNLEMPDESNVKSLISPDKYMTENGFTVYCVKPMSEWRLKFNGKVVRIDDQKDDKGKVLNASFDLKWFNFGPHFDFVSPNCIAEALAIEPWSRELFQKLQATHQTHYEQFGRLEGEIEIEGFERRKIRMTSMRDHTITSHRRWSELRRYIMIIFHLEDGTCIHTSLVSMPEAVFSHLTFGYIITKDAKKLPVDKIHLHLSSIGEDRLVPKQFSYSFEAGGQLFQVDVQVVETVRFKMGLDLNAEVFENMCLFWVNGQKGYGFSEWEYRIQPY